MMAQTRYTDDVFEAGGPAQITQDACFAMYDHAQGSRQRLRILAATAAYLAETENAPAIDVDIVDRAAALQPVSLVPVPANARAQASRWWYWALGGASCGVCVALLLHLRIGVPELQPMAAQPGAAARLAPASGSGAPHATLPVVSAPAAQQAAAATGGAPQPAATQPAAPQPATPAPQMAPAPQASNTPPAAATAAQAPPVVQIRFYLASPGSPAYARFLEARLVAAGYVVRAIPDLSPRPPRRPTLVYFHPGDADVEAQVASRAMITDGKPILARHHRGAPPHGFVELVLP
jgi:hypothetical protein